MKGISGGERKRTSIGYELITDPNLLLCDEPTSGLDSSTALKIIQMLKKEATEMHRTVICTIHQPSAEIFNEMDRLLLLQDGHQIYQGPIKQIPDYLSKHLGAHVKKFQNPADFIIKMAQAPEKIRAGLNLDQMVMTYLDVCKPMVDDGMGMRLKRYSEIDTNFQDFAENR